MNIYSLFFKVTQGPLISAVISANEINSKARKEYVEVLKSIGARTEFYAVEDRLIAIVFDENPDPKIYKRVKNGWYPKKNCTVGKKLSKKLSEIKTVSMSSCLETVRLSGTFEFIEGNSLYISTLIVIPSDPIVVFIQTPWFDENPKKLKEYVIERDKGTISNMKLEHVLWKPSIDLLPIKEWEVLKAMEDWNSQHR